GRPGYAPLVGRRNAVHIRFRRSPEWDEGMVMLPVVLKRQEFTLVKTCDIMPTLVVGGLELSKQFACVGVNLVDRPVLAVIHTRKKVAIAGNQRGNLFALWQPGRNYLYCPTVPNLDQRKIRVGLHENH